MNKAVVINRSVLASTDLMRSSDLNVNGSSKTDTIDYKFTHIICLDQDLIQRQIHFSQALHEHIPLIGFVIG